MKRIVWLIVIVLFPSLIEARVANDSAIYQGTFIKVDLLTPSIEAIRSKGGLQSYEISASVRLKDRFYPTLEGGYAFGKESMSDGLYTGRGGFGRVGMDLNGLKKNPNSPHALLIGIRVGTALQEYRCSDFTTAVTLNDQTISEYTGRRNDWWGEVVGGCHVQMVKRFYMGWDVRLKCLFTRKVQADGVQPYYIPGYGRWGKTSWGFHYYIGCRL